MVFLFKVMPMIVHLQILVRMCPVNLSTHHFVFWWELDLKRLGIPSAKSLVALSGTCVDFSADMNA